MAEMWVMSCSRCGQPLEHEITPDNIYRVEVICAHCGSMVDPSMLSLPLLTNSPYDDIQFVWSTPEKYRQSKILHEAELPSDVICIMQPLHAKSVVDHWLIENKGHRPKVMFDELLNLVVGCKTYVLMEARLPVQFMLPEQAKNEYPDYFKERL